MWLNGVAAKAKLDAEAGSAPADAQAKVEAQAGSSTMPGQLDQLRELGESLGRKASAISEDAVRAVTGLVEASLGRSRPPPPAAELQGTFALVVKSGMLGKTHLEPRAFSLIRGKGKETIGADGKERISMRGGGGVCYELQSVDMKGEVHRIVLQKTDEVTHLDHGKLSFSLVSAAAEGEEHIHRFKFTDKEEFTRWAHALMVAIKNSERRNRSGTLVQLMQTPEGEAIKLNAEL
jgi:hypothetical protein